MKTCSKCNKAKELTEFGKRETSRDGLQYECKACVNEYQQGLTEKARKVKVWKNKLGWNNRVRSNLRVSPSVGG